MKNDIQKLLDQYIQWLKDKTLLRDIDGWTEITTPFLDRHNDYIQIYAKKENNSYVLTDDGYILDDLALSGCTIDTPKRKELLEMTLKGYGVTQNGKELTVTANSENFAPKKHSLVQAMLSVNDLFYMATPYVVSLFIQDVCDWLSEKEVRFSPDIHFTGKTGFDHKFDFLIPPSKLQPERVLKAINTPSRTTTENLAWAWIDTKGARPIKSRAYALLNDTEKPVSPNIIDALNNYDILPIPWSHRDEYSEELAA